MEDEKELNFDYIKDLSDEDLIHKFNKGVGIYAWGNSRAKYVSKLHKEFLRRDFDASLIVTENTMSLAKRIKLVNNKIVYE